jgi:hypothetical protein
MKEDIVVSMGGLELWFENKMRKYKNSPMEAHLKDIWDMMTGNTVQDDSLETFFEKELTN